MLKKIKTIILSRFKKETGESWIEERRKICAPCPYNTLNQSRTTIIAKIYKFFSNFIDWLTDADKDELGDCKCGCPIYYLTREEESECPEGYWSIYIPNSAQKEKLKNK